MSDNFAQGGAGIVFFDEDFDLPPPAPMPPEPEIIEPTFTAEDLRAAREQAARESRDAALLEAETSASAAAARTLEAVAEALSATREDAAAIAEQSAEAMIRLLLDCFATAFPALSARHGARETAAILRAVLPALRHEPRISVRVSPHAAQALEREIDKLDPDVSSRVKLVPTDALANGDVRIAWENGSAVRDAKALWAQIEDILAPAGLLSPAQDVREHALVD